MSNFIIDASLAAKWIFLESNSDKAEHVLMTNDSFLVPEYFYTEMDSIISKKVRTRQLEPQEALEKRQQVKSLAVERVDQTLFSDLTFQIAISLSVTFYDAIYLATAIEFESILWTADERLVRGLETTIFKKYITNPLL